MHHHSCLFQLSEPSRGVKIFDFTKRMCQKIFSVPFFHQHDKKHQNQASPCFSHALLLRRNFLFVCLFLEAGRRESAAPPTAPSLQAAVRRIDAQVSVETFSERQRPRRFQLIIFMLLECWLANFPLIKSGKESSAQILRKQHFLSSCSVVMRNIFHWIPFQKS